MGSSEIDKYIPILIKILNGYGEVLSKMRTDTHDDYI